MTIYTPDELAAASDGELADHHYDIIDLDTWGESDNAKVIEAEIARRGLSRDQLDAAWNGLAKMKARTPRG